MRKILAFFLGIWITLGSLALAQEAPQPDYAAWEKMAGQAEQILQSGGANDARLAAIRVEVVKWRSEFQQAEGTNATRIATLKDQIAALGPVPAEGQTESEDIATRRKELNEQLSVLQAPGLSAVEAYGRADGIIRQIDAAQREQQANELLRLAPSPLNPANWAIAAQDGYKLISSAGAEVSDRLSGPGNRDNLRGLLPVILGLLLVAALLLTKGMRWVEAAPRHLSARASERTRAVVAFAASLGQFVVPFFGVLIAVVAVLVIGFTGDWIEPLLLSLPGAAVIFFGGVWLSRLLFPAPGRGEGPLALSEKDQQQARFNGIMLSLATAVHQYVSTAILPLSGLNEQSAYLERVPLNVSDASAAVWHFPVILLGSYFLYRLGNVLRRLTRGVPSESLTFRSRIGAMLGVAARIIALLAVVLAAIGYISLANAQVWPIAMTMALVGFLILMQDFVADIYAMAKGGDQKARDALMPMLIGFGLILLSLPLFALIWGVRPTEIVEFWTSLRQGVSIGNVRISPTGILAFFVIFALGYSLTGFLQSTLRNTVLPKTKIDPGGQNAIISGVGYIGVILAILLAITSAGIDLSSLAFIAGALSLGIGFGLQNIVSNFVSGIILLIERPITVGDWIEVGGKQGIVQRIAVRSTHIRTFDRTEVVIPNSDLVTQPVTNWTRNNLSGRIIVPVKVVYGTDTREAERILLEIAEDQPTVQITPPPAVIFSGMMPDGMNLEIRAVVSDVNGGTGVISDINHAIVKRFSEAGIEMPTSQREQLLRNAEALLAAETHKQEAVAAAETAPAESAKKADDKSADNGSARKQASLSTHRDEVPAAPGADGSSDGETGHGYGERSERD